MGRRGFGGHLFPFDFLRIPIAFSLGLSAVAAIYLLDIEPAIIVQSMVKGVDTFALLAVPLFIIAGSLWVRGDIQTAHRLFQNSRGNLRGGLGQVNVLTSTFFGGISGSAVADISSIGCILIPMMTEEGYDREFAVGITLSSAVQSIMIPPSHNMVIYALLAGASVGKMFMAGLVPGLLLGASLMIYTAVVAKKRNYPMGQRVSLKEGVHITLDAIWGLGTIFVIVFGVVTGVFTVTESAAIAVVYSLFVSLFVYRETKISDFFAIVNAAFRTVSMVMLMIACSAAFGWVLAYIRLPVLVAR
jgi:tripartite ATP-independent transporter DctM subunit